MLLRTDIYQAGYAHNSTIGGIRFELPAGRILAVIGPNGSGKTTLIRALSGVLPFIDGQVHVNGTDLLQVGENERARLLAVVPQSTHIPPSFSVQETVMMGRTPYLGWMGRSSKSDELAVEQAMRLADVMKYRDQPCGELSAGERQRVILARALAQDTPVLLMDEPTSHLDLRYQIEFLQVAVSLACEHGKTVLIALHDLNLAARFGDIVMALKAGEMAALGTAKEILTPQKIYQIYGLQVQVFPTPDGRQTVIVPA